MFKLQSYGNVSDYTIRYIVELDKPYTVKTFIEAIFNRDVEKREWGSIKVIDGHEKSIGYSWYKNGKLEKETGESVLDKPVIKVKASGCYSRMDYIIEIEDTTNDDTTNDDTEVHRASKIKVTTDDNTKIDYASEIKRSLSELVMLLKNCCKDIIEEQKRQ